MAPKSTHRPAPYWVVPEGIIGDILNALSFSDFGGATRVHYHVIQSLNAPSGIDVNGPYDSAATAQTYANQLNSQNQQLSIQQGPQNVVESALGIGQNPQSSGNQGIWQRIGEGAAALILLDIGLKTFTGSSVTERVISKTPSPGNPYKATRKLFKP